MAAYNTLVKVRNQTLNGTWYLEIRGLQSVPIDLGLDENGYARVSINIVGIKRP
jgi:hypothetical protein